MVKSMVCLLAMATLLAGCRPTSSEPPKPMKSAVQPAPSGCYSTTGPVARSCADYGPLCATEDGNDGADQPCWWIDKSDGRVWYRP
jgi:hypothetical protein